LSVSLKVLDGALSLVGFGFDDITELTYTSGDFTEVTNPPNSEINMTTYWYTSTCNGAILSYVKSTFQSEDLISIHIDEERNIFKIHSFTMYQGFRNSILILSKNTVLPIDSTDSYTSGIINLFAYETNVSSTDFIVSNTPLFINTRVNGEIGNFSGSFMTKFHPDQFTGSSGNFIWSKIPMYHNFKGFKGYVNPILCREGGYSVNRERFWDDMYFTDQNGYGYISLAGLYICHDVTMPSIPYTSKNIVISGSLSGSWAFNHTSGY
jgi:hypothetical protein